MKTKYFFMLMVACFMGTQAMNAQKNERGNQPRKRMSIEQMSQMQGKRLANELGLDDATSDKFLKLYEEYMKELNDVRKKNIPPKPEAKPGEEMQRPMPSDADVDKMMREDFAQSRKILDIREKYYDKFRKILTPKQVQKVYNKGQMNRGRFQKEMNRRAGMKPMNDGNRPPMDDRGK